MKWSTFSVWFALLLGVQTSSLVGADPSVVAVFKVAGGNVATPAKAVIERARGAAKAAVVPVKRADSPPKAVSKPAPKLATKAGAEDEWAEF